MSCHFVYQKDGGAKFMRPIHNREEYLQLRDSERQRLVLQAMQQSVALKGAGITHNCVRQMLKNWQKQGLVTLTDEGGYRKVS